MRGARLLLAGLAVGAALLPTTRAAGDPRAAENQYRIARRLAAQGSPQAAAALRKVVELDPQGLLADDALLDLASIQGVPEWPEELGRAGLEQARHGLELLNELIDKHPEGNRVTEARLRRALALLEPLASRDPARARVELLAIATSSGEPWVSRARYALAWLDEREGRPGRARPAYQRLYLDHTGAPVAPRAAAGIGRLLAREGEFGESAAWFEEAERRGAPAETETSEWRELAVRGVLRGLDPQSAWSPAEAEKVFLGVRAPQGVVRLPGGDWLVADRRGGVVVRFDPAGKATTKWTLDDLQDVAVDPYGRGFAAAGDRIYRLPEDGDPVVVAPQGDLAPVGALACDAAGDVWIVDRRGSRVARWDPAAQHLGVVLEDRDSKLVDLAWDGSRIVAADQRSGTVVAILSDGTTESYGGAALVKPVSVAADGAGQTAVLDVKAAEVVLFGPDGTVRQRLPAAAVGVERPEAISLGTDGSLDLYDAANGTVARIP